MRLDLEGAETGSGLDKVAFLADLGSLRSGGEAGTSEGRMSANADEEHNAFARLTIRTRASCRPC